MPSSPLAGNRTSSFLPRGEPHLLVLLRALLFLLLAVCVAASFMVGIAAVREERRPFNSRELRNHRDFGRLPLYFIENRGQVDAPVSYYAHGEDTSLYFTSRGLTIVSAQKPTRSLSNLSRRSIPSAFADGRLPGARWAVTQGFVGGNSRMEPAAGKRGTAVVSYLKGSPSQWKTGLRTYASIEYRDVWEGIDLIYEGSVGSIKYSFVVEPGADPAKIRVVYRGATALRVNGLGQLEIKMPGGGFRDDAPYAYQETRQGRVQVGASYVLDPDERTRAQDYGFRLGRFDRTRPLVIDPVMLVYAGYFGGPQYDLGNGIAVDGLGNAYVTGVAGSTQATFPDGDGFGSVGGADQTHNGDLDAFVAKVNPSGTGLVYATYIGGADFDEANSIAVDGDGNAYITGETRSTEATFPDGDGFGTLGGPDLTQNGDIDAFVAKVNAAGTGLVYAGYIGGADFEGGFGIALDGDRNAYVTGETRSTQATFPDGDGFGALAGPDQTHNGMQDAFVAKVNAAGSALVYAGYLGGSMDEYGPGIAVDSTGNAYLTGTTGSTQTTFPDGDGFGALGGPDLTHNGGFPFGYDAYVAKVNTAGTSLAYAGYVGGAGDDTSTDVAVDATGSVYLVGITGSTEATFPDGDGLGALGGPDPTYNGATFDAYVAKVNAGGTALSYAGYIGGSSSDGALGIAVDAAGSAHVIGNTFSTETTFPDGDGFGTLTGPDVTSNGSADAYVVKLTAAGTGLLWAGYIGGANEEHGDEIALDSAGSVYVTGYTDSTESTFPDGDGFGTLVGPDVTNNGESDFDGFVAKVADVPTSPPALQLCGGKVPTHLGTSAGEGIAGTSGPDVIAALGGDDVIDGAGGDDIICAGDGSDSLTGGAGNDTLDGEGGTDRVVESADVSFTLTNTSLTGLGTDTLAGIEAATLTGGPGETLIDASAFTGPVVIAGGEGEDLLIGGSSNDAIDGGGGHVDTVLAAGDVNFTLSDASLTGLGTDALTGIEVAVLSGGPAGRVIDASSFTKSLFVFAGGGGDHVTGGSGRDSLFGEGGKDRMAGRGGRDLLIGGGQADQLLGGAGADRLGGRRGNDRLLGGSGKDRLDGGKGVDVCIGGPAKDVLKACELT